MHTQHTEYIYPFIWETALPVKSQLLRHIVAKSRGRKERDKPKDPGKGQRVQASSSAESFQCLPSLLPQSFTKSHGFPSPAGVLLMPILVLKLLLKQHMLKNEVLVIFFWIILCPKNTAWDTCTRIYTAQTHLGKHPHIENHTLDHFQKHPLLPLTIAPMYTRAHTHCVGESQTHTKCHVPGEFRMLPMPAD